MAQLDTRPTPTQTGAGKSVSFLGREHEIEILAKGVADARMGRGGIFLIAGEPGIGKTRLADEVTRSARASFGMQCLWGRCWEGDGAPAFWPWVQIVRAELQSRNVTEAAGTSARSRFDLAQLVPEMGANLPGRPGVTSGDSEPGGFALFDAAVTHLVNAAERESLAIVIDDLQWADAPSLVLLKLLARTVRRSRLIVIGTYRDVEARLADHTRKLLVDIGRDAVTFPLRGFSQSEVATFVERSGKQASGELVTRVFRATQGNPFFIDEILRLWSADVARDPAARMPISDGVRETVQRRLNLLPDAVRDLLRSAAAYGREIDAAVLQRVTGLSEAELADMLALAGSHGILTTGSTRQSYSFRHDLIRETLYASLSAAESARLHERIGEALERRTSAAGPSDPREIAHHFAIAATLGNFERAVASGAHAAEWCRAQGAWEDAILHARRCLDLLDRNGSTAAQRRLELLTVLADAQARAGMLDEARDSCRYGSELAKSLAEPQSFARFALIRGTDTPGGRVDAEFVALLQEAIALLGERDTALRARLLARLASAMQPARDPAPPIALAHEAIALARRHGDPATIARVLHGARAAFRVVDSLADRIAIDTECLELAEKLDDRSIAAHTHTRLAHDRIESSEFTLADAHIAAADRLAAELHSPAELARVRWLQHMRATMIGDWDSALRFSSEARAARQRMADPSRAIAPNGEDGASLFGFARARQRRDELAAFATELFPPRSLGPLVHASRQCLLGNLAAVREQMASFKAAGLIELPGLIPRCLIAGIVARLGDAALAQSLYDPLTAMSGRNAVWAQIGICEGSCDRFLGLLAGTAGALDRAAEHFERALAMNSASGSRPHEAATAMDYAELLVRRAATGDSVRVTALLARVDRIAADLGMSLLAERSAAIANARQAVPVHVAEPVAAPRSSPPPPQGEPAVTHASLDRALVRNGEYWSVHFKNDEFAIKDSHGMQYIAYLLEHPDQEFHVTDLSDAVRGVSPAETVARPAKSRSGATAPALDVEAKRAYKERLAGLRETLDEATRWNDSARASAARREIEFLAGELAKSVGLGGRDRRAGEDVERARVNITSRIRKAIERIARESPDLAHELTACIKTGTFFSFVPSPGSRRARGQ